MFGGLILAALRHGLDDNRSLRPRTANQRTVAVFGFSSITMGRIGRRDSRHDGPRNGEAIVETLPTRIQAVIADTETSTARVGQMGRGPNGLHVRLRYYRRGS